MRSQRRRKGLSRRDFLRSAAFAAGGLWLAGCAGLREGRGREFRFVHYTDSHIRPEFDVPRAVEMSLAKAKAARPSLMIVGGDLITDGYTSDPATASSRFDIFLDAAQRCDFPIRYCLGNHDVVAVEPPQGTAKAADPREVFRSKLGLPRTHFSFDHGGWHFVVLDSMQIENDRGLKYVGAISAEQLAWLAKDLEQVGPNAPIVVVTHIPLLTVFFQREKAATDPAPADRIVVNAKDVIQLLSRYKTKLVLQGHLHIFERIEYGGITFITTGAVSGKWWRGPNYGTPEGFGVVTCRADAFQYEHQTYGWVATRPKDK